MFHGAEPYFGLYLHFKGERIFSFFNWNDILWLGLMCDSTFDDVMCWPPTAAGTTAAQYCPSYISNFNVTGNLQRYNRNKSYRQVKVGKHLCIPVCNLCLHMKKRWTHSKWHFLLIRNTFALCGKAAINFFPLQYNIQTKSDKPCLLFPIHLYKHIRCILQKFRSQNYVLKYVLISVEIFRVFDFIPCSHGWFFFKYMSCRFRRM